MLARLVGVLGVISTLGGAWSQQPNTPAATLLINASAGPPYPIAGISLTLGQPATLRVAGNPQSPIVLAAAMGLALTGLSTPLGTFDLEVGTTVILANGLEVGSPWTTDAAGSFFLAGVIPASNPVGVGAAYQAAVFSSSAPQGFVLTAASEFTTTAGVQTQSLVLGDDTSALVDLTPFGFTLPFYTQSYSQFYVNSNGIITFEHPTIDFTSTPSEFRNTMPKICAFWCDLKPNVGGEVLVHLVPPGIPPPVNTAVGNLGSPTAFLGYSPLPVDGVRVEFNAVPELGAGAAHTFSVEMYAGLGDVYLFNSAFNGAASVEVLMGVGPGYGQSTHAQKDLSQLTDPSSGAPTVGGVNESAFEWFGDPASMPLYNALANPWDMAQRHVLCFGSGAGTPAASFLFRN